MQSGSLFQVFGDFGGGCRKADWAAEACLKLGAKTNSKSFGSGFCALCSSGLAKGVRGFRCRSPEGPRTALRFWGL